MEQDGFYIANEGQLNGYNTSVSAQENYMGNRPENENGTNKWATPRKHPETNDYAMPKHKDYDANSPQLEWVEELDETWNEDII